MALHLPDPASSLPPLRIRAVGPHPSPTSDAGWLRELVGDAYEVVTAETTAETVDGWPVTWMVVRDPESVHFVARYKFVDRVGAVVATSEADLSAHVDALCELVCAARPDFTDGPAVELSQLWRATR